MGLLGHIANLNRNRRKTHDFGALKPATTIWQLKHESSSALFYQRTTALASCGPNTQQPWHLVASLLIWRGTCHKHRQNFDTFVTLDPGVDLICLASWWPRNLLCWAGQRSQICLKTGKVTYLNKVLWLPSDRRPHAPWKVYALKMYGKHRLLYQSYSTYDCCKMEDARKATPMLLPTDNHRPPPTPEGQKQVPKPKTTQRL